MVSVCLYVRAVSRHCPDRQTDTTVVLFSVTVITQLTGGASRGGPTWAGKDRAGGASTGQGGARVGKDRAGGSSTNALCTRFTLVDIKGHIRSIKMFLYLSKKISTLKCLPSIFNTHHSSTKTTITHF